MARNTVKALLIAAMGLIIIASAQMWAAAAPSYMQPEEVKSGMTGEGYTVFSGSEPSPFTFKVLAVTKGESGLTDLIIVRVGGSQIDEIGGIAAGMSGSPCYIGGKLLGALSHVLDGPDPTIGLITPMSQMVKVLEAGKLASSPSEVEIGGWGIFSSAGTPIWVSGLAGRALDLLKARLSGAGVAASPLQALGVGPGLTAGNGAFKAGSSIAVQIVNGDIEAGSIGTLTWIEGKSFIAFGHPFMNMGEVGFPMSKSQVLAVLPSDDFAFKLGTFEKPAAVVTQDRTAGIAGMVGAEAVMADVQVKVNDMQTGRRKTSAFRCVPDERIMEGLISSAVLSAVDGALMRVGEGTAFITVSIDASGTRILREDMLWSDFDIADAASAEVAGMLGLILANDVEEPDITAISISIDIAPAKLVSVITGIELPSEGLISGTMAKVGIKIRPFRGSEYVKYVDVQIPEGAEDGPVTVEVLAGASEEEDEIYTIEDKVGEVEGKGIPELKEAIESADQNNGIRIEIRYDRTGEEEGTEDHPVDPEAGDDAPLYSGEFILQSIIRGYASEGSEIK